MKLRDVLDKVSIDNYVKVIVSAEGQVAGVFEGNEVKNFEDCEVIEIRSNYGTIEFVVKDNYDD